MAKYIIEGGRPLNGTVQPSGNKNEALPAVVATLLSDKPVTLKNLPRIGDILTLVELISDLGATCEWIDDSTLMVDAGKIHSFRPKPELCHKIRASILLLGPLLSRFGKAEISLPGGDVIGARRIDTHWEGTVALGGKLELSAGKIKGRIDKIVGTEYYLDEPSVTATENLMMLASRCQGVTTLHNAACEPHVVGLGNLLNAMGAKIDGLGTNQLKITGVESFKECEHEISSDFMEVGSFICLGAISRGKITIKNPNPNAFYFINRTFKKIGIDVEEVDGDFVVDGTSPLVMERDVSGRNATIYSGPWPAFPTDLMSVAIVAATQSSGTMLFFEKMFEGRMFFTDKLMAMGANITLCDPHRVVINGPSQLYGAHLTSPDVRAGMSLLMASLIALGKSEIDNIYQIERGYNNIAQKLESLGAAITRMD